MHFGFALDLPHIDLWNIDLLDTHLNFLDTNIPSKHFFCLQDVFKTRLEDVFSVTVFHLPRRFQDVFKTSWKTKSCYAEDILNTCHEDVLRKSWRPTNVCWDLIMKQCGLPVITARVCVCGMSLSKVTDLPQSHCGDYRQGILFSWLHVFITYD